MASISQKIASATRYAGKTLTLAAYVQSNVTPRIIAYNGGTSIASKEGTSGSYQLLICNFTVPADITDGALSIRIQSKSTQAGDYVEAQWAALYEGAYTADTLPNYVPKDKHVEMLNCNVPLAPRNLLDNSDFTNPVNQRGATTTSQYKYFLDRWIARLSDISLAVGNSGLTLTSSATANIFIYQKLLAGKALNGKTVTVAVCDGTGNVATTTTNLPTTNATSWTSYAVAQTNNGVYASVIDLGSGDYPIAVRVGVQSDALNKTIRWAALYEGSYTADTIPAYQPKGYAAELAECQRYYRIGAQAVTIGKLYTGGSIFSIDFPKMRIYPTIKLLGISSQGWGNVDENNYTQGWGDDYGSEHYVNFTSSITDDVGKTVVVKYENSADL